MKNLFYMLMLKIKIGNIIVFHNIKVFNNKVVIQNIATGKNSDLVNDTYVIFFLKE